MDVVFFFFFLVVVVGGFGVRVFVVWFWAIFSSILRYGLAKTITAPQLIFAVICAVWCGAVRFKV